MTNDLWPSDHHFPVLTRDQMETRVLALLTTAARRHRERNGTPAITDLVRLAFDEERPALIELVRKFIAEQRLKS